VYGSSIKAPIPFATRVGKLGRVARKERTKARDHFNFRPPRLVMGNAPPSSEWTHISRLAEPNNLVFYQSLRYTYGCCPLHFLFSHIASAMSSTRRTHAVNGVAIEEGNTILKTALAALNDINAFLETKLVSLKREPAATKREKTTDGTGGAVCHFMNIVKEFRFMIYNYFIAQRIQPFTVRCDGFAYSIPVPDPIIARLLREINHEVWENPLAPTMQ
jgi:hypothetical protein